MKYVSQLEHIAKGDVAVVEKSDPASTSGSGFSEDSNVYDVSESAKTCKSSDDEVSSGLRMQGWTSVQFDAAMSILKEFFKQRSKKCRHCEATNPGISKPTFGWFHMVIELLFISLKILHFVFL